MRLMLVKKILSCATAVFALSIITADISATTCIYKDVNNQLVCTDTNIYDCKSNLKGTPEYDKTCAELEGRPTAKDIGYDYMRESRIRSCMNQCSSRCSGYKTQGGATSCVSSCQAGCN